MLYEWLAADSGIFNVLNYITFRSGAAVVTAFLVTVLFGDAIINFLRARQGKGQPIRDDGPEGHIVRASRSATCRWKRSCRSRARRQWAVS